MAPAWTRALETGVEEIDEQQHREPFRRADRLLAAANGGEVVRRARRPEAR
jgi:hypothetical protein